MGENAWNIHNRGSTNDQSSIFYIHPSDSSTSQIVSVKFNGTGFTNWQRSMLLSLSVKTNSDLLMVPFLNLLQIHRISKLGIDVMIWFVLCCCLIWMRQLLKVFCTSKLVLKFGVILMSGLDIRPWHNCMLLSNN